MAIHTIKKGLDLPIAGKPQQTIDDSFTANVSRVAVLAADFMGMKPKMAVKEGDRVRRGQLLFEDRKTPGVRFTALGAGEVISIHRGEKRALQSVVIKLSENEQVGTPKDEEFEPFASWTGNDPESLSADQIRAVLVDSGLWTSLRTRPFSKVPLPTSTPAAIFVTATDTNPLAPWTDAILADAEEDFYRGLAAITRLHDGMTYLCKSARSKASAGPVDRVQVEVFDGVHPAGNVGTHIHLLTPVHREKTVWHIGYQDVIAIGRLFATGRLDVSRVVSLAGPSVRRPRLVKTRLGACLDEVVNGELHSGEQRVISGSVLSGRQAKGDILGYLGRYHQQISVLPEDRERHFLGWLGLGFNKYSTIRTHIGRFLHRTFKFTTSTQGSERNMVPIGMYERVMPLDILPTFLLRALAVQDTERAVNLGALELDEEDLALCSFVDPGKSNFAALLRQNLNEIEKEG